MAGVQATSLMVGPGNLYVAAFGTDDSLVVAGAAPSWTGWTYMGATDDGINLTVAKSYANHKVDQVADWVASTITERSAQIEVNLAEPTLANLQLALNGGTTASTANWDSYTPDNDLVATQETYHAVGVEGITLGGKKTVLIIRKVLNVADVKFAYKKDAKTMFACSWAGHYVSNTTAPFIQYIAH